MAKVLKTAVAGLGMGLGFHVPGLVADKNYELVALCDTDKEKLDQACARYAVRGYQDYEKMLAAEELDLVVIATPTQFHVEHSISALKRKIAVFLEKPMAKDLAGAKLIQQAMLEHDTRLMVYQPHRTRSDFLTARQVIESGLLGRIYMIKRRHGVYFVRTSWQAYKKNGGGTLNNYGSHYVDALLNLAGGRAEQVSCELARVLATGDADDFSKILVKMDNGIILDIEMSLSALIKYVPWEIYGDKGTAVYTQNAAGQDVIRVRYFTGDVLPEMEYLPQTDVAQTDDLPPHAIRDFPVEANQPIDIFQKCYEYFALGQDSFVPVEETLAVMDVLGRCHAASRF